MRRAPAVALLLLAGLARGEDSEEEEEDASVVVTGTRTAESEQRATVRTEVVTREEAERRGATSVGEALSGELGVQVNPSAYGFLGNPAAIQIQGLDLERVLILEDGERVIGGVGGAIDLGEMPLGDVERIEVVMGPSSALYGTSAIGGVVNIISGRPWWEGPSGRFRLEGRYPWGVLGAASGRWRSGDAWVGIDASAQQRSAVHLLDGSETTALPARRQYFLGARASAPLGRGTAIDVRARWVREDALGRSDEAVPGLGVYRVDLPDVVDRWSLGIGESAELARGIDLKLRLGRQWFFARTERDRFESPIDETRTRDGSMHSGELSLQIAEGPRTWVAGTRAEVESYEQRLDRLVATGQGDIVSEVGEEVKPVTLGSGALYAQLSWKLLPWLTVLAGARGELHLHYGAVAAPRLAIALMPLPWLSFRVAGGRGFRAPSARELGFAFDHSALGYRVVGNRDLAPETSWGLNGDVSLRPLPGASLRAGAWVNWIEDLIALDYLAVGSAGVDDYTYSNVERARTFGGDLRASYERPGVVRAELGYSYCWTRNDTLERPLEGRPPHTTLASVHVWLPLGLEATLRHRVVTDAFIDEELRSPGYQTLDLRLARDIWGGLRGYAGALNVIGARKDPARLGDQRPIEGRMIYLGVSAQLPAEE